MRQRIYLGLLPAVFIMTCIVVYWQWPTLLVFIIEAQQHFHKLLTVHVRQVKADPVAHGGTLALLSLAYGVFHAAGPGHGKAVLVTYLSTQKENIRRGVVISFLAALLQSLVAVVVIVLVAQLLELPFRNVNEVGLQVEQSSYLLVMLVGAYLAFRALWQWRKLLPKQKPHSESQAEHDHSHHHSEGDPCCHHAVVPEQKLSIWQTATLVFSMGMRPCSGAIVVLIYAQLVGVFWFGVLSVVLMGLGTGTMVALLAVLSVLAREWVTKYFGHQLSEHNHHHFSQLAAFAGGVVLIALGWSLFDLSRQIVENHPLF